MLKIKDKLHKDLAGCGLGAGMSWYSNWCGQTPVIKSNCPSCASMNLLIKNLFSGFFLSFNIWEEVGVMGLLVLPLCYANYLFHFFAVLKAHWLTDKTFSSPVKVLRKGSSNFASQATGWMPGLQSWGVDTNLSFLMIMSALNKVRLCRCLLYSYFAWSPLYYWSITASIVIVLQKQPFLFRAKSVLILCWYFARSLCYYWSLMLFSLLLLLLCTIAASTAALLQT